jgi:2-polyprenyl-3-methyl-5-hydroxy-6-metoxy-1,4-benzoquinol methylase
MNSKFELVKCPLCKKNNYEVIINSQKKKEFTKSYIKNVFNSSSSVFDDQVVKCKNCKFIYLNPRIKQKIIDKSYSFSKDRKFISQNKNRIKTFKNTLSLISNQIDFSNKKILDIGSGGGAFLKACKDRNITAEGIEPNKWLVNYSKKKYGINISTKNLNKINKTYHIVSLFDVLEHIPNIKLAINKIYKLVKKDGFLIINVPDHNSLARKILKKNWPFYLTVHLHYFDKKSLSKLLDKKFKLFYSKSYWQVLELSYVLERGSKYFRILKMLNQIIIFLGLGKISLKYNMGQTLFIFKKK